MPEPIVVASNPPLNLDVEAYAASTDILPPSDYASAPASAPGNSDHYNDHLAEIAGEPAGAPDSSWLQMVQVANLQLVKDSFREKEDEKHRMGDLLKVCFDIYREKNLPEKLFYRWLDSIPEWERVAMIRKKLSEMSKSPLNKPVMAGGHAAAAVPASAPASPFDAAVPSRFEPDRSRNINPSMIRAFLYGVRYLDRAARKQYRLTFSGGVARLNGQLFDTHSMRTVFSGLGSAIWVQSPKDNFYAGNHVKGQFHHSSFLSGGDVKCGGEMQASKGMITRISAKSGHYKPSKEHFANAVRTLGTLGVDLSALRVVVWKKDRPYDPASLVPAAIFLRDLSKWETWGNGAIPIAA